MDEWRWCRMWMIFNCSIIARDGWGGWRRSSGCFNIVRGYEVTRRKLLKQQKVSMNFIVWKWYRITFDKVLILALLSIHCYYGEVTLSLAPHEKLGGLSTGWCKVSTWRREQELNERANIYIVAQTRRKLNSLCRRNVKTPEQWIHVVVLALMCVSSVN